MKKLSIAAALVSLSIATPVFACPGQDAAEQTKTAKADKAQDAKPAKAAEKAKTAEKAKPADKVSQK